MELRFRPLRFQWQRGVRNGPFEHCAFACQHGHRRKPGAHMPSSAFVVPSRSDRLCASWWRRRRHYSHRVRDNCHWRDNVSWTSGTPCFSFKMISRSIVKRTCLVSAHPVTELELLPFYAECANIQSQDNYQRHGNCHRWRHGDSDLDDWNQLAGVCGYWHHHRGPNFNDDYSDHRSDNLFHIPARHLMVYHICRDKHT